MLDWAYVILISGSAWKLFVSTFPAPKLYYGKICLGQISCCRHIHTDRCNRRLYGICYYNTSVMNHRIESFKTGMEENTMIAKLVTDLIGDTVRNLKTDFALLSLERYLRSSNKDTLKIMTRRCLSGLRSQSLWTA